MFRDLFQKRKYAVLEITTKDLSEQEKKSKAFVPDGTWVKCDSCEAVLYKKDVEQNLRVCSECGYHFRISAQERIKMIVDEGKFVEFEEDIVDKNPLSFPQYESKIQALRKSTELDEAVLCGIGSIAENPAVICVMDSRFLMGSMGSVVGKKISRAIEKSMELKLPIIIFTASGGARMQEGMFSLMQMAKVSAVLAKHNQAGLLYITVLTDPTTGGVSASFGMLGDIIFAEPGALIGFTGPRVIEQTIKQKLPEGFQRAEFLLEHGFVDKVVERKDMRKRLGEVLLLHKKVVE